MQIKFSNKLTFIFVLILMVTLAACGSATPPPNPLVMPRRPKKPHRPRKRLRPKKPHRLLKKNSAFSKFGTTRNRAAPPAMPGPERRKFLKKPTPMSPLNLN